MLLGLASGRRLTLLGLASGGLACGSRLLALLRPLLVRLHPSLGMFSRSCTGIGGFRDHRRHHCSRHQEGDHVPFHQVDSFIPSSPLNMAAGSHNVREPALNPLFRKEKYPEMFPEGGLERSRGGGRSGPVTLA